MRSVQGATWHKTIVPRSQQGIITQVSDEIEGRVTEKLSKELSRTESRFLGALSRLYECLLSLLLQDHSRSFLETSRNTLGLNQGTNEEDAEASISQIKTTRNSGQKMPLIWWHVCNKKSSTAPLECLQAPRRKPASRVNRTSAVKTPLRQSKPTNFVGLQQMASDTNCANFNNNIHRVSKLPKSLTATMPTFEGKSEKFELFEDLFQTTLKFQNCLVEDNRINYFHSLRWTMRCKLP